jgi:hypothetical protein
LSSLSLVAEVPTLGWPHVLLRLSVAALLGGAIGLERELRERQAGLRTHLIVCVGSALFTLVSAYGFRDFFVSGGALVRTDPTRIAAQIVTGIGFLGAGAIIRQGLSVRGLTTAATLWLVAAVGMAAGATIQRCVHRHDRRPAHAGRCESVPTRCFSATESGRPSARRDSRGREPWRGHRGDRAWR